jgi:hypothetical protein
MTCWEFSVHACLAGARPHSHNPLPILVRSVRVGTQFDGRQDGGDIGERQRTGLPARVCSHSTLPWDGTSNCGTPLRTATPIQNTVPNNLLANEPSLSTQGIGGSCGNRDAYGNTFASGITLPGNRARKTSFIPPSSPL